MPDLTTLSGLDLCRRCTGRIFATVGASLDNTQRGDMLFFSIKALHSDVLLDVPDESACRLCNGIFSDFEKYYNIVKEELGDTQYETFLIGSVFDADQLSREADIHSGYGSAGESMKKEFNREFGKYFSARTEKEVDFLQPDITIVVNTIYDYARVEIRSIYISGKYNKLRRDLPQTRWIHKPNNNESVEYYIGEPIMKMTTGENYFLHAAGREDVDVRMLGRGRDFVLEIARPRKRTPDLESAAGIVNSSDSGVTVRDLEFCGKDEVKKVKSQTNDKTYRVLVEAPEEIDGDLFKSALGSITGKVIYQRTPLRVSVRRADLVRERCVRESEVEQILGRRATFLVRTQSGMYIKELVNGDGGRTNPSLSSAYGKDLTVVQLDVTEINRGN